MAERSYCNSSLHITSAGLLHIHRGQLPPVSWHRGSENYCAETNRRNAKAINHWSTLNSFGTCSKQRQPDLPIHHRKPLSSTATVSTTLSREYSPTCRLQSFKWNFFAISMAIGGMAHTILSCLVGPFLINPTRCSLDIDSRQRHFVLVVSKKSSSLF